MRSFLILILMSLPAVCLAQTSETMLQKYSGRILPLVCITTVDGSEPTSTNVMHPEGLIGASITDVVPKEAQMQIYRADTLWYDSGEYIKGESGLKIKHRGNSSAYYFKNKPFKLSLEKKADLIEVEEGDSVDRRSKDWVLLNCGFSIRLAFVSQLEKMMGMEYAPRVEYANVIINNDYRGIYILSENVTRDKTCRVDVDKGDGYIIELDPYFWNEPFYLPSTLTRFLQWTMKYPKAEDLTEEQEADIREDIARLEKAIADKNYPEVIDVRSVARWVLLHDILGTYDSGGCNIFVARKNREPTSLMRMPVAWDMDACMLYPDQWSKTHTERGLFFSRLFANEQCQEFVETYIDEWQRVCEAGIMERMRQVCRSFPSTVQGKGLKRSYPLHAKRWNTSIYDVKEMSQTAYEWFDQREGWLNSQVSELADAIQEPKADKQTGVRKVMLDGRLHIIRNGETYSADGKRVK